MVNKLHAGCQGKGQIYGRSKKGAQKASGILQPLLYHYVIASFNAADHVSHLMSYFIACALFQS